MLKTMANLFRPATDRRTTRQTRSRSPPPAEVARTAAHQQHQPPAPTLARPLSSKTPFVPLRDVQQPNASLATPPQQLSPTRAATRKRSITEVDTPDARPPDKANHRRSHGDLLASANGTTKKPDNNVHGLQSRTSTPKPVDAAQTPSTAADKKSLRSANPKQKTSSQLADLFDDYETTIANWEEAETSDRTLSSSESISVVNEPLTNAQIEHLKDAAAEARAARLLLDPDHVYTRRAPFDYTPYANALPATEDPLADTVYTKVHNRHERKENTRRNDETRKLQYKMYKAPSVLDELEGEDWHKVFAIDKSERCEWESKRKYFTKELQVAIGKQEALRKAELEKRRNETARRKRGKETPTTDEGEDEEEDEPKPKRSRKGRDHVRPSPRPKTPEAPKPRRPPRPHGFILEWEPSQEKKDKFQSFYRKGQRPASFSGKSTTRGTRSADAPPFGVPLPDIFMRLEDADLPAWLLEDNDFELKGLPTQEFLPEDEHRFRGFTLMDTFVTKEFLAENERKRRRRKRESAGKTKE